MATKCKCMYGITLMAEMKGKLGQQCESAPKRNITALKDMMIVELCESHYQEYLIWDREQDTIRDLERQSKK